MALVSADGNDDLNLKILEQLQHLYDQWQFNQEKEICMGEAMHQAVSQPSEEERRRFKRHHTVSLIKQGSAYQNVLRMQEAGTIDASQVPPTPDPDDDTVSKRTWKKSIHRWREDLKLLGLGDEKDDWNVGETVSVLRTDGSSWRNATIVERYLEDTVTERYSIAAGTLKVKCDGDGRYKYITPDRISSSVRKQECIVDEAGHAPTTDVVAGSLAAPPGLMHPIGLETLAGTTMLERRLEQPPGIKPAPGMLALDKTSDGASRYQWTVDARKVRSSDKVMVSPSFNFTNDVGNIATFKMMITPKAMGDKRGESSFKKAKGKATIEVKCEANAPARHVMLRFWLKSSKEQVQQSMPARGHNFSETHICNIDQVWDLPVGADETTFAFYVEIGDAADVMEP